MSSVLFLVCLTILLIVKLRLLLENPHGFSQGAVYIPWYKNPCTVKKLAKRRANIPTETPYFDKEVGIWFITYKEMVMLDWDYKEGATDAVSRQGWEHDILESLRKHVGHTFRVYRTPGGLRAFLTSRKASQLKYPIHLMTFLGCDPAYIRMTDESKKWSCRVSPKPGRKNDYVAKYLETVGGEEEDPELMELIAQHDKLCGQYAGEYVAPVNPKAKTLTIRIVVSGASDSEDSELIREFSVEDFVFTVLDHVFDPDVIRVQAVGRFGYRQLRVSIGTQDVVDPEELDEQLNNFWFSL